MKKISVFLVLGILLFYFPLFSLGDCLENSHLQNLKLDCGGLFHCPFILNQDIKMFILNLTGLITFSDPFSNLEGIPLSIYHPPEA